MWESNEISNIEFLDNNHDPYPIEIGDQSYEVIKRNIILKNESICLDTLLLKDNKAFYEILFCKDKNDNISIFNAKKST